MIFDLIQKRRSVFPAQYNDRSISISEIEQILAAANRAPNHKRTEPWRFKVMTGDSRRELGRFLSAKYSAVTERPKRSKTKKLLENPMRSAAVIGICMQRDPKKALPEWEEVAATAMAVQNMWLCCTEMGIGCYWSSPALIEYMHEFFNLAEGERCLGFFYMGRYDAAPPEVARGPIGEKVVWMDPR